MYIEEYRGKYSVLRTKLVKAPTATIFKGILESQESTQNAKKFAEIRHPDTSSGTVYHAGIYHDGARPGIHRPLSDGPGPQGRRYF
jgi:hypothetical protein